MYFIGCSLRFLDLQFCISHQLGNLWNSQCAMLLLFLSLFPLGLEFLLQISQTPFISQKMTVPLFISSDFSSSVSIRGFSGNFKFASALVVPVRSVHVPPKTLPFWRFLLLFLTSPFSPFPESLSSCLLSPWPAVSCLFSVKPLACISLFPLKLRLINLRPLPYLTPGLMPVLSLHIVSLKLLSFLVILSKVRHRVSH